MVGCSEKIKNFPDQFDDKLLAQFCTLLVDGYTVVYSTCSFSEPVD